MKIEQVDFHYLAADEIRDIGDGSQDALLVRVVMDDGSEGWGECEASPLVSIAAWCCPMSHLACKPLKMSVVGAEINSPADIFALTEKVRENSFDLLQADHTLSGIDIALWDMLGRKRGMPVWKLLGYEKTYPKTAYASQLFGDTPEQTYRKGVESGNAGFRAAKFGWGPFGRGTVEQDVEHVRAAREGLGNEAALMIDAGTVWKNDVARAAALLPVLKECRAVWLEEPFTSNAFHAYSELTERWGRKKLAGGEGAHNPDMAFNLIDFGKVGFIQIDTGRIGAPAQLERPVFDEPAELGDVFAGAAQSVVHVPDPALRGRGTAEDDLLEFESFRGERIRVIELPDRPQQRRFGFGVQFHIPLRVSGIR